MKVTEKIAALRAAMTEYGADGVYVPSSDPHMTEYLPAHWRSRAWLSGFTGSAGTLCVTQEKAALWTDGRYFIQAERQLAGSGIELMRMGQPGVPTVEKWLTEQLPEGGTLAVDGACTNVQAAQRLEKAFAEKKITLRDHDFIEALWVQDRPPVPATQAWRMDDAAAGASTPEKIAQVRRKNEENKADALLVCRLDSVAWLMNLRADDVEHNPFALSYCLVEKDAVRLFINAARVPDEVRAGLEERGVALCSYEETADALCALKPGTVLWYEPAGTSMKLLRAAQSAPQVECKAGSDPVQLLKAVKNKTELECQKHAHRLDGAAMVRFEMELRRRVENGEAWDEWQAGEYLRGLRLAEPSCFDLSFETIAAYGANAAMMHYSAGKQTAAAIEPHGFLLVDSGGQYRMGTTDITRTYALGSLTHEEREAYTLVLKCHIAAARAVFHEGTSGQVIDILARETLWRRGLDYRCGTGHGVGFVGAVHEGPQGLSTRSTTAFVPGMTVTDEPGLYTEGKYGVRIESELICVPVCETEYGKFYGFETFTYCPIDTRPLLTELMTDEEIEWLNDYHAMVRRELDALLSDEERAWLENACAPLKR